MSDDVTVSLVFASFLLTCIVPLYPLHVTTTLRVIFCFILLLVISLILNKIIISSYICTSLLFNSIMLILGKIYNTTK